MPDESSGEKTEEATPRRQQRMREEGRVPKSRDLSAAGVMLGGMIILALWGGGMYDRMFSMSIQVLEETLATSRIPVGNEIMSWVFHWGAYFLTIVGPFLVGMVIAALVAGFGQVGFMISAEAVTPKLNKINPISGFQRIFSLRSIMTMVMNLMKLSVVIVVAWLNIAIALPHANGLPFLDTAQGLAFGADSVLSLGVQLALLLLVVGTADFLYQLYQHNVDIRMTKQEVKEEMKDMEGDPHVKARRRQIQREMAQQRMMQEVPGAEVVVRNPTHYAVAIRFKPGDPAPKVVAKGMDRVAFRIIEKAIEHGVPTWQDPPLARQLYKVDIDEEIPAVLFQALAEILAHVLQGEKRAAFMASMEGRAA